MTKDSLQQNSEMVSENKFSQCDPPLKMIRKEYNKWENQCFPLIYSDLNTCVLLVSLSLSAGDKDGSKVTTVVATPGQGPDRPQEVSYTDTKVIGNGSFGVVYQAKLCDSGELVAIKKVLQDKRFKVKLVMTENSCRHN